MLFTFIQLPVILGGGKLEQSKCALAQRSRLFYRYMQEILTPFCLILTRLELIFSR